MEHRFEYDYTENEEYSKELLRYLFLTRKHQKILFIAVGVLMLVLIGTTIYFSAIGSDFQTGFLGIAFCIIYYGVCVLFYFLSLSTLKKRVKEMYGGKYPTDIAYFTDDELHYFTPGRPEITVALQSVKRFEQTKNLVLLYTKTRAMFAFHKDGFTKGTAEELKAFLKEKGVK